MTLRHFNSISTFAVLASFVLTCALLISTSCQTPEATAQGSLDADLSQARSEFVESDGVSWQDLHAQAEVSWRQRSQYAHLTRAAAAYERAHELVKQDPTLEDAERDQLRRRQLLRSAHAYFLLGYMKTPLQGQRMPAERADARVAFERGAIQAKEALSLELEEAEVLRLLVKPTPSLLERAARKDALPALYWYALNTHFSNTHFRTRGFAQDSDATLTVLEFIAEREPAHAFGSVLGALGSHHARHGYGGSDASSSKQYFDRAVELGPNNLMVHVMYAEHYAVQTQNAMLFDRQIDFVLNSPIDLLGSYDEENRLAVMRARQLQNKRDALFY